MNLEVRLVSWNLHACVGTDGRLDPARVADVLAPLGADLIALQEVDGRKPAIAGLDQLTYLAATLGMPALAGPNLRDESGEYGNALLGRHPLLRDERIDLSVTGREPRGAIDATYEIDGRPLRVLVTHLGLRRGERLRQIERLRERIEGTETPTVLAGDLNEWRPERRPRRLVPEPFVFCTRARTFPSRFAVLPLDRVLASPAPTRAVVRVENGPAARCASDHLPLVVDLLWEPGP